MVKGNVAASASTASHAGEPPEDVVVGHQPFGWHATWHVSLPFEELAAGFVLTTYRHDLELIMD